ncbi:hypothetical protein CDL15_Pgr017587 [Punica granatum]|uniref:Uncharacterized protein n=1 Tax=Punica granatum TaxID=22663 RepID=A0A218W683_PUNGR|nr:hypothetical protein CDL15_Pgr017587 [Punica granatum]
MACSERNLVLTQNQERKPVREYRDPRKNVKGKGGCARGAEVGSNWPWEELWLGGLSSSLEAEPWAPLSLGKSQGKLSVFCALGGTINSSALAEDQEPETSQESAIKALSVFPDCFDVSGDHCVLRLLETSPDGWPRDV